MPVEAETAYERALAADWKYLKPYARFSALLARQMRFTRVEEVTRVAVQLNPVEFPGVYFYRAIAEFNLQEFRGAEESARRTIELDTDGNFPHARYLLGLILELKGDSRGALDQIAAFASAVPDAARGEHVRQRIAELESKAGK